MENKLFKREELVNMAYKLLLTGGLRDADALTIANDLVTADMRNLHSHGVSRIPMYLKRIEKKVVNPQPNITVEKVATAALKVNGDDGMGFLVAHKARGHETCGTDRRGSCGMYTFNTFRNVRSLC